MIRDDLVGEGAILGNKWRKLYTLYRHCSYHGYRGVLSWGGSYSNHVLALARWSVHYGIPVYFMIRGQEKREFVSPVLRELAAYHPQVILRPISRSQYRLGWLGLSQDDKCFFSRNKYCILPEGGLHPWALEGFELLALSIQKMPIQHLFIPCGTGITAFALRKYLPPSFRITGVDVLSRKSFFREGDLGWLKDLSCSSYSFDIWSQYHCGGYGKYTQEYIRFLDRFYCTTGILVDRIYVGKVLYALDIALRRNLLPSKNYGVLHTGGLYPWTSHFVEE